jgi:hypothetical protein
MRMTEGLRLRIKDVDYDRHVVIVREAKGNKDRVVMLPRSLVPRLRQQLGAALSVWEQDRQAQRNGVQTPHALEKKDPKVDSTWGGSGCSHRPHCRLTRFRALNAVTICLRRGCNAPSRKLWCRQAFANRFRYTHCATVLPRTCCNLAQTFGRFRICWGTATCPPP